MLRYGVLLILFLDILKEAPNEYDLLHLLADVDYLWDEIGIFFGVDHFILDNLHISLKDDIVKLSEVIYSCVSTTELLPFTWETVISVIEKLQRFTSISDRRKVDQIHEHILKGKKYCEVAYKSLKCIV